jgi:glucose uptake protein GlcU
LYIVPLLKAQFSVSQRFLISAFIGGRFLFTERKGKKKSPIEGKLHLHPQG